MTEQPSLDAQIGSYVPVRFLANWTLGERFLGRRIDGPPQPPTVIIDRLWPEFALLETFTDEFHKIERWTQLNHPGIARVYEVGFQGNRPYVVSEFFEGRSLELMLQRRDAGGDAIPVETAFGLALQVAQALEALHGFRDLRRDGESVQGKIIHGELNPSRVLVDNRSRVKVLGGWGSRMEACVPWAIPPRSMVYRAPEELWGRKVIDHRADLFSFGVVLFETLVGRFCPQEEPLRFLQRVLRRDANEAASMDKVPESVRNLLQHLLQREPGKRLEGAGQLVREIQAILEPPASSATLLESAYIPERRDDFIEEETTGEVLAPTLPLASSSSELEAPDLPADPHISLRVTTVIPTLSRRAAEQEKQAEESSPPPGQPASEVKHTPPPAPIQPAAEVKHTPAPVPEKVTPTAPPKPVKRDTSPLDHRSISMDDEATFPMGRKIEAPKPTAKATTEKVPTVAGPSSASSKRAPSLPKSVADALLEPTAGNAAPARGIPAKPVAVAAREAKPSTEVPPIRPDADDESEEDSGPLELQDTLNGPVRGFLVFREGSSNPYRYPLVGDCVTLGRSRQNTYQILSEIKASRSHCEFRFGEKGWRVLDKGSTNGTYVNGQPIRDHVLKGREKIIIGFTTLRFLLADKQGNPINATQDTRERVSGESSAARPRKRKPHIRAALVRNMGTPQEKRYEVTGDVFNIGRAEGNSLRLDDARIAPSHCEIRYQDGSYVIEDHLSEHGTLVNGFLVDTLALDGGEELTIGGESLRFVLF